MKHTHTLKETPDYAQGVARTLLLHKRVEVADIARTNALVAGAHGARDAHLYDWLNALVDDSNENAESLALFLSQAWQVARLKPEEWHAFESAIQSNGAAAKPLPKALLEASQSVVMLGRIGSSGVLKLGVLDASDMQALQRLAFIYPEPFEWRVLSLTEYARIQAVNGQNGRFTTVTGAASVNGLADIEHEMSQAARKIHKTLHTHPARALGTMTAVGAGVGRTTGALDAQDAPIVRYIQDLLMRMVKERASDVHFEPFAEDLRIRARVDGVLHEVERPDVSLKEQLVVRLKIMAQLDIAEKRLPQDGRINLETGELGEMRNIDCRVSTLPTVFGEKIVVRFLNAQNTELDLNGLGYEPEQLSIVNDVLRKPHGMILMTGPTGSGKTVSLYACLNLLNQEGVNISTVEDPVEIIMHGVNQVSINEKAGIQFATVLRAFLRQDPDILMVGEIRDLETADIAVKAAQTGHLVFSTLHTNDATMALSRLVQMGVTPYNVAASVSLLIAQRLVRRLCSCKQPLRINPALLLSAGMSAEQAAQNDWQAYAPVGCVHCHNTGYIGRTGVFQVVPVSNAMQALIASGVSSLELSQQAVQEGHMTLRQAGLHKVRAGVSSLEEVMAVTL